MIFMTFDLYKDVSKLGVSFAEFLTRLSELVFLRRLFYSFLYVVFFHNNHCLIGQMNPTKKNLKTLDLNPVHLADLVQHWVGCCMA